MEIGDKTVNLTATKGMEYKDQGVTWYKDWRLQDIDTGKVYGIMIFNSRFAGDEHYIVNINNPIHPDLGYYAAKSFSDRAEALAWAREQIENMREPTFGQLEQALKSIREWRYQDEISDDFAYSNGKIARWDDLERKIRAMMAKVA